MTKGKNRIWFYVAVLTAALLLAITSIALAQVWTDQQDYTPGSVVTISGGNDANGAPGYYAGGTVDVVVTGPHDPAVAENGWQLDVHRHPVGRPGVGSGDVYIHGREQRYAWEPNFRSRDVYGCSAT